MKSAESNLNIGQQYLVGGDDSSQHASSASNPWASEYASSNPDSNSYSKKKGHAAVQSTSSASTSKLTAGNLTNLNIANRFAKISLMEKEIDDSSSSGSECASTIRGNDDLPNVKAAPNGGHVQSEWASIVRIRQVIHWFMDSRSLTPVLSTRTLLAKTRRKKNGVLRQFLDVPQGRSTQPSTLMANIIRSMHSLNQVTALSLQRIQRMNRTV